VRSSTRSTIPADEASRTAVLVCRRRGRQLLAGQGFVVARDDLMTIAEAPGIAVRNRRSLRLGHITVADR
jgi:hypothetical protein